MFLNRSLLRKELNLRSAVKGRVSPILPEKTRLLLRKECQKGGNAPLLRKELNLRSAVKGRVSPILPGKTRLLLRKECQKGGNAPLLRKESQQTPAGCSLAKSL